MADNSRRFSAELIPAGSRVACRIEYDGSRYHGWQIQPHLDVETVQGDLEQALTVVAAEQVRVHCAGRTDAGVHGFSQVVHFDTPSARSAKSWVLGTNSNLPSAVRVHWAVPVAADFHARFSARSRRYRYIIADTPIQPALLAGYVSWCRRPLAEQIMHAAAQSLLGEQDFSAFRAASCQSTTPMRNVQEVSVSRQGSLVVIDIRANAFLHHMVRNIAGSLMAVGTGRREPRWIAALLAGADRTAAADTAPPDGLYLVEVEYPAQCGLPDTPYGPLLLGGGTPL